MAKYATYFQTDNESNRLKIKMIQCGLTPAQVAKDLSIPKEELIEALKENQSLGWVRQLTKSYLELAETFEEKRGYKYEYVK